MHLKEQLIAAGLGLTEADFDVHESDLYVRNKPGVRAWLKENYKHYEIVSGFIGVDKWAGEFILDIPFANGDYWDKKQELAR